MSMISNISTVMSTEIYGRLAVKEVVTRDQGRRGGRDDCSWAVKLRADPRRRRPNSDALLRVVFGHGHARARARACARTRA